MSDPGPSNAEEEEQLVYGASAGPSTFRYEPETARGSGWDAQGSEDDDDDLEFEEVGGAADLADAPKPRQHTPADDHHDAVTESSPKRSEALEIVLEKAHRPELKDKKSKQKKPVIPGSDKKSRIQVHNVNLLCLLVAFRRRAHLLFHDEELQCRILSQAPIHVINPFQTAKSLHTSLDRSRAFEAALQDLVSWWWRSFQVHLSIPGLQSVTFAKAVAAQPVPELPLDSDTWLTEKQKRKILAKIPGDHIRGAKSLSLRAVEMAGSRDMSAQLFVALCTALDLPARLVVSLQPLDWRSSGSTTSTVEDEEASQAESTTTAGGKGKAHNKSKAKRSSDVKNKAKETGASKLAKKAGLAAQASASRFGHRTKTMEKALTDNDSDIEMEEVSISSPRPGGFLTEQADVSETLRHAGPSPSLRRSKPKLKDFQRSPSPDAKDMQRKPVMWAEIYNRSLKEWVTVDPTRKRIRCQADMEPVKNDEKNKMTYVIAIEQDGSIRDVTARYVKAFGAVTVKNRAPTPKSEQDWWERILSQFKRKRTLERDREEERQMSRNQTQEAMPTSIAGFKDHPLFALERHLKREEAIYPRKQLGLIKEEAVYPRSSVVTVRSAEQWMREGLKVKEGEQPLKTAKSRAVTINKRRAHELAISEGRDEDTMQGLYAQWQTVKSIPPPIVDGIVPRNGYGNLDLFAPHMLPRGDKGTAKIAKQLGIDFAEAVTGFDFHKRRAAPAINGIVVAQENEEVVMEAYWESEHAAVEKAHKKKQDECLKRWKKLIAGLTIRQRLTSEYISQNEPISNGVEGDNDDDDETTEEPAGQFKDVEADDAELAARAAPVTQQKSKPTMLRLTHNQLPPMQEELRRQKQQQQQDSSDDEQEEEEPEPSEEEAKPVKRAPRRKAARKRSVVALDSEDESEPSDSDLEEIKPAIKRPRRAVTQKKTVATSRPRRSTARKPQGAKGSNG